MFIILFIFSDVYYFIHIFLVYQLGKQIMA